MSKNLKEILVILGNGFDIALGIKSSFRDFYDGEFWPFKRENKTSRYRTASGLDRFLNINMRENWYDLENLLAQYALSISLKNEATIEADKKCFVELKEALINFVDNAQRNMPNLISLNKAVRFLKAICEFRIPVIYSFNYTGLNEIASLLGISDFTYTPVHGTVQTKNIVVGIEDNVKILPDYDFLKKVSEPTYKSTSLFYDLMRAKEVVIFGHSLGENDFHFFRRFFQFHSDEMNSDPKNKCKITIFTANSKSRMEVLSNLRAMNDGRNNQLFAQNDLQFIRMAENDSLALDEFELWMKILKETKERVKEISML